MATFINAPNVERRSLEKPTAHHYFIPASYQAYRVLHAAFVIAPIVAGVDKFFNFLVNWEQYLFPKMAGLLGVTASQFMRGVGIVEIAAGLLVAFKPKIGGMVVCLWLLGIIVNLLMFPSYFDIALRDFGLALGAFALSRLSVEFNEYRRPGRVQPLGKTKSTISGR